MTDDVVQAVLDLESLWDDSRHSQLDYATVEELDEQIDRLELAMTKANKVYLRLIDRQRAMKGRVS